MIIVNLQGGLGNQLFQYATAFAASKITRKKLFLDITGFNHHTKGHLDRAYVLDHFNISAKIASQKTLDRFRYGRFFEHLFPLKRTHFKQLVFEELPALKSHFYNASYIVKPLTYRYEPEILTPRKGSIYLDGYWQSFKYFEPFKEDLMTEFSLKGTISKGVLDLKKEIETTQSVSLHIRRTDYLSTSFGQKHYKNLPLNYYYDAIGNILKRINSSNLFIFSDDIEWCKTHFNSKLNTNFVTTENPVEDLYLMSSCKHQITANSSFSWWAAWLNQNKNKIVIAPARWYKNVSSEDMQDLLPQNWIKIVCE